MSPFSMLGDPDALACEGDSCLLPAAVATVGATTAGDVVAGRLPDASSAAVGSGPEEAAVSR